MKKICSILSLCLFILNPFGQNPVLGQDDKSPGPRNQPAIAFDTARNRLVLFGGIDQNGKFLQDTWEFDGFRWERKTAGTAPGARAAHAVAYDAKRRRVVLFGGQVGTSSLSDTWEWDGATWKEIKTSFTPPARVAHALTYNSQHKKVMLFGGTDFSTQQTFNDTWEFDGKNWFKIKVDQAPEGRFHHAMAFDTKRQRMVLFGGNAAVPPLNSDKFKAGQRNDVWEFDGRGWGKINAPVSPPARDHLSLAYDGKTGRTILFGGFSGGFQDGIYLGDTWAWDGKRWVELKMKSNPEARGGKPGMIYDSKLKRLILFGGGTPQKALNDMWFLTDGAWIQNK